MIVQQRKVFQPIALVLVAALILSACSFAAGNEDAASGNNGSQTGEGASGESNAEMPVDISVDLAGPGLGTFVVWMDDSELVFIPGGEFIMGADGNDNPQRAVTLSPFWIHRTEVTNGMYSLCVSTGNCSSPKNEQSLAELSQSSRQDHPVTGVEWQQAAAYCEWINGRLPTEAEWEKTARGENGNIFPWGNGSASCDLANFGTCLNRTALVSDYLEGRSYFEALGFAGNVAEWVSDWYDPLYYQNAPDTDPQGPASGVERVYRGGGFASPDYHLPSAVRFSDDPQESRIDLGFRCVVGDITPRAPYCVASQTVPSGYIPEYPQSETPQTGSGCSYGYVDFETNVDEIQTEGGLECETVGNRVRCSGPAGTSQTVIVCREGAAEPVSSTTPAGGGSCDAGYTPGTGSSCNYDGSTPTFNCGGNICAEPTYDEKGNASLCPPGMYFDTLAELCVGTGDGDPVASCLHGFEYDSENGCCSSPTNTYPGCGPDAFMSSVGCIPHIKPGGGSSLGSCEEVVITTGPCTAPTEEPEHKPDTPDSGMTCPVGQTQYCYFDTLLGVTVCNCY